MDANILNDKVLQYKGQVSDVIRLLHELTIKVGDEVLIQTVSEVRERLKEPFMFVIVGEVKTGKSSFINALLATGKEVCKVAPDPCTDIIQEVVYGESHHEAYVNEHLKKITLPVDILKEIAIVDTPGTNTISAHHQEITERFIPSCDLTVFVFEAKNPYRQSAWDFFDFIKDEWHKKVIFILQQSDLMEPEDLAINIKGLEQYAKKKGVEVPMIFAVSAKKELSHQLDSGFGQLRAYVSDNITGGKAPYLKLLSSLDLGVNIHSKISAGVIERRNQFNTDIEFRQEVTDTLAAQEARSKRKVVTLLENLLLSYDSITAQKAEALKSGLSFGSLLKKSVVSIFSKKESPQSWLKELTRDLEEELHTQLNEKINIGVTDIAESIQQMAKIIDLKVQQSETSLTIKNQLFQDIAEERTQVYKELQEKFAHFMSRKDSFFDQKIFPDADTISPNIATGGGVAVIGVVLLAATKVAVIDITGGVLSSLGLVFAGATAYVKRKQVLKEYYQEVEKGKSKIVLEVEEKLYQYIGTIRQRIENNFLPFDTMLDKELQQVTNFETEVTNIQKILSTLGIKINQYLD